MRALLVVLALVLGLVEPAEARRGGAFVIINTGDTIIHLQDIPTYEIADEDKPLVPTLGYSTSFHKLGYRHERFGVFWFDLWRWGGEFVIYDGNTYISISDETAAEMGASVPWRYHLPDGLLILIAAAYYAVIGRRRRRVKTTLYIAGFMLALAIAFFFMGLTWEFMIPLAIALHHGLSARGAMRANDEHAEVHDEVPAEATAEPAPRPSTPRVPRAATGTPPPVETRPSQPIVVERPVAPVAPVVVPMRADDSVDGPKLLR